MSGPGVSVTDGGVIELYARFRSMLALSVPHERAAAARDVIGHPVCQSKLRIACARVTRNLRCAHRDLREDALQDAACLVIQRLQSTRLKYTDEGPSRFGGWLYSLCLNAVRTSWRAVRAEEKRWSAFARPERLADLAAVVDYDSTQRDRLMLALNAIHSLEDRELAGFLADWMVGLSGAESAQRRQVSRATVCRRREAGLAILRRILARCGEDALGESA